MLAFEGNNGPQAASGVGRAIESLLERFESQWEQGKSPAIADFLPESGSERKPALVELAHIDLERRIGRGEPIRVETYLAEFAELASDPAAAVSLIAAEFKLRRTREASLSPAEFFRRFPQHRDLFLVDGLFFPAAVTPPRQLGDYELLDVIGSGGMGTVYCARHLRLGKLVALKILRAGLEEGRLLLERFKQEMHLIGRLNHPNIVTALDAREENGTLFLVMELVDGAGVDRLSAAGPLGIADACEITRQVALGLEHAHEHRLVHRDMKPSNLILSRRGVVKIVDFGLARVNEEQLSRGLTDAGTTMGTLDFIAPEQCEDASHADIRADIYSLGCTLFNLLTGHAPFAGPNYSTAAAKVRAHCAVPPPLVSQARPEVSAALSGIVARMMAKQPTQRFSTPGEVAEKLAPFTSGSDLAKIASSAPIERGNRADTDVLLTSTPQANQIDEETKPITTASGPGRKIGKPLLVGSGLFAGLIILAAVLFTIRTKDGNLVVEVNQPDAVVQVSNEEGKVEITRPGEKGSVSISVEPGKHRLQVAKDGFQIFAQDFVMEAGGNASIAAKLIPLEGQPPIATTPIVKTPIVKTPIVKTPIVKTPIVKTPIVKTPIVKTKKPLAFETPGFDPWAKEVAAQPPEAQVESVVEKLQQLNPGFDGKETHKIDNGVVTELQFLADNMIDISPVRALAGLSYLSCYGNELGNRKLSDLSPLKGMQLTRLDCRHTSVADLSSLEGMPLTSLHCQDTMVSDLSPLRGLPLDELLCDNTQVSTLSPLAGMPLASLMCYSTRISDLSPLKGMRLRSLACNYTRVSDLSPLEGMPLLEFQCQRSLVSDLSPLKGASLTRIVFTPRNITKGLDVIRQMNSLTTIGPYWGGEVPPAEFWKRYDAGYFGIANPTPITTFKDPAFRQWMKDVAALAAQEQLQAVVRKLQQLNPGFDGQETHKIENGAVAEFAFSTDNVTDVSPLRALSGLQRLICRGSRPELGKISDLSPLAGLKLTHLDCGCDPSLADLSPLEEMPLNELSFSCTGVSDLSPLKGMGLRVLYFEATPVSDLSALAGMALTHVRCNDTGVSELLPLKGMPLTSLSCGGSSVDDLSPLKDMPLTYLDCGTTKVSDLSPLHGAPLQNLSCDSTRISDLAPLQGMPLTELLCEQTNVSDLSSLQGMNLTKISFPAANIAKGIDVIRQMKTLTSLGISWKDENQFPPAEFWKKYDAGEFGNAPASPPPAPPTIPVAGTWKPAPEDDILPGIALRPAKLAGIGRWNVETVERRIAASTMAVSADGKHVACNGGAVRIYSIPGGDFENELPIDRATAMAWSPDGARFASGRESDGFLRIFDAISRKQVAGSQIPPGFARDLCWSRDGQWLAWGNSWDSRESDEYGLPICRADGKPSPKVPNPETVRSVAFCPGADWLATAGSTGVIRIWDRTFKLYREIPKQPSAIHTLSWQPEGKWIAAGYQDGHLRVWSIEDGKKIADFVAGMSFINHVDVSKDGRWVAVAGQDCHLGVFSAVDWSNKFSKDPFFFDDAPLVDVKWLPDGGAVVFLDDKGIVRLATVSGTPSTHELSVPGPRIRLGGAPLAPTHDGTAFASIDSDGVRIRCTADSGLQEFIPNGSDEACAVAWNRDGSQLATGTRHGAVRIWDARSGRQVGSRHFSEPVVDVKVDWSVDGLWLAAAGRKDDQIICLVWNADKEDGGRQVFPGQRSSGYFTVAWSPDGKLLALRAADGIHVAKTDDWTEFWASDSIAHHNELAWSPDSRQILAKSNPDEEPGEIQIFELKDSKPVRVIREHISWQAAWNSTQDQLAIAEHYEAKIKILNTADWSTLREIRSRAGWLAWLPHRPRLLTGDSGESLTVLWNTDTGQPEWTSTLLLDNKVAAFNAAGQLLPSSTPGVEDQLRYMVERDDKTLEMLSFADFNRRFPGAKLALSSSK
jgi:serine/threonine protein kinase/WD40 repeat protein/Leucine-rich repeat (LRR) protein